MSRSEKFLLKILTGKHDKNIAFSELCGLFIRLGFTERIKGDHHILTKVGIPEIINIQPRSGLAKPYQVKQVRELIVRYKLGGTDE